MTVADLYSIFGVIIAVAALAVDVIDGRGRYSARAGLG